MERPFPLSALALAVALVAPAPAASPPAGEELAGPGPAVRVHWTPGAGLPDGDGDGVPDAAREALRVAAAVAGECRAAGLPPSPGGGDDETDLWLAEEPAPPGVIRLPVREAVRDPSGFRAEVARRVAEAALAGRVPGAPPWWTAPTACWIAARAAGVLPRSCGSPELRWNHPEPGLLADGPLLAPANLALLEALGDTARVRAALRATWRELAADASDPVEAIDRGLAAAAGLDLPGLFVRAGIARIASGNTPPREALWVDSLPVLDRPLDFPLAPLGGALLRLSPDPRFPPATALEIDPGDHPLRGVLLARRKGDSFDRVDLRPGSEGIFRLTLPWHDYREAFLLLVRPDREPGPGEVLVRAEPGDAAPPFELASFSATSVPGGTVFVEWRTGREEGVVAWLVERSLDDGRWEVATPVPLPSLGTLTGGGSYVVPAGRVPAGSVSRWRLVAILGAGLRWTGPVVRAAP